MGMRERRRRKKKRNRRRNKRRRIGRSDRKSILIRLVYSYVITIFTQIMYVLCCPFVTSFTFNLNA